MSSRVGNKTQNVSFYNIASEASHVYFQIFTIFGASNETFALIFKHFSCFIFQLLEFLEPLQVISGSAILKVRELAALAISSILSKKQGSHRFCLEHFVLESLLKDCELSHNQCHGRILQVRKLYFSPNAPRLPALTSLTVM